MLRLPPLFLGGFFYVALLMSTRFLFSFALWPAISLNFGFLAPVVAAGGASAAVTSAMMQVAGGVLAISP
jgi:hypothetical protein